MKATRLKKKIDEQLQTQLPYVAPGFVYEGRISTRAGTPTTLVAPEGPAQADPADLFPGNKDK